MIRDLLGLEVDVRTLLPGDDSSYGFDNMAGTLGLSSTLVEAYVSAAGKISRLAIGAATSRVQVTYRVPEDTSQRYHIEGLPFGTRGGMRVRHEFPADGDYTITVNGLAGDNMSPQPFGSIPNEQLEVLLDGQLLELLDWNPERRRGGSDEAMQVDFHATAGSHTIGVTFLQTNLAPVLDVDQHFMRDTIQTGPFPGLPSSLTSAASGSMAPRTQSQPATPRVDGKSSCAAPSCSGRHGGRRTLCPPDPDASGHTRVPASCDRW